jgi:hypothetical protein
MLIVITFASDRYFGLVDISLRGAGRGIQQAEKEASSIVIRLLSEASV